MRRPATEWKTQHIWMTLAIVLAVLVSACAPAAQPTPPPAPTKAPAQAEPTKAPATAVPAPTKAPAAPTPTAAPAATAKPAASKPLDPPVTVKTGSVGTITEAAIFTGIERGYFAEQGIKIEYEKFDSASRMVAPLSTNQIQAGTGQISAGLFNAVGRGLGTRVVGPQARYDPGFSAVHIIVRKDLIDSGAIKDYKDLKGKTIAIVAKASASEFAVFKALEKGGLKMSDANVIEMPFPDMIPALANKAIDVGLPAEPTATIAVDRGLGVLWHQVSDVAPRMQFTVLLFSPQMVQNTELSNRWMVAYLKGLRDYNDAIRKNKGREEMIAILQKYTTVKDRALYDKMVYASLDPNGKLNMDSIKEQMAWFTSMGQIQGQVDLDAAIDTRFVDYALSVLGPYKE